MLFYLGNIFAKPPKVQLDMKIHSSMFLALNTPPNSQSNAACQLHNKFRVFFPSPINNRRRKKLRGFWSNVQEENKKWKGLGFKFSQVQYFSQIGEERFYFSSSSLIFILSYPPRFPAYHILHFLLVSSLPHPFHSFAMSSTRSQSLYPR